MHTPSPDSASGASLVIGRRFLERLPLLAIMAKDDQRHMLALDQIQEFSRACTQLLLVVIGRPGPAIRGKQALQDDGINRQQNLPGLWQVHQDRLMPRCMPTGLDQPESRQQFGVSLNQPVAQGRLIPVSACGSIAYMTTARQRIVVMLDDKLRPGKDIVVSCMVHVEMGADQQIDVVRMQTKIGEMLQHIFSMLGWWRSWRWRVVRRKPAIDENVPPIACLNEIAT